MLWVFTVTCKCVVNFSMSPKNDGVFPLALALPAGPLRLVFLRRDFIQWTAESSGIEVQLSAPPLYPGELVPMHVKAQLLATRMLRFVGNADDYEFCVIDQSGQSQLRSSCVLAYRTGLAVPKDVPIHLIEFYSRQVRRLELKDLPDGEVQTIELP